MKSKNIRKLILCIIAAILIPLRVSGAAYWQGNNVFNPDEGSLWGVTKDEIVKVTDYKRVYSFDDINSYSAYITNNPGFLGNSIENSSVSSPISILDKPEIRIKFSTIKIY